MSRRKINKPRRDRPPLDEMQRAVDSYVCGHCPAEVSAALADGVIRLRVEHSDGCPVLTGSVSDLPDSIRAAERSAGLVVADARTGLHFTLLGEDRYETLAQLIAKGMAS